MIDQRQYQAYLLRLQRESTQQHWRITLQHANNGEVLRFASELEFLPYLLDALEIEITPTQEISQEENLHEKKI